MSEDTHITYLFGAGASYNSMPVVSELNNDLKKWASLASDRNAQDKAHRDRFLDETPEQRLKFITQYVKPVVDALNGFATVDTLARFYTLRGKKNELYVLKKVIDAYFFFRQFGGDEGDYMLDNAILNAPKQAFDSRYDSLFAAILKDDCSLPSNVSIISWNYDLEVERSLAKFRGNVAHDNFDLVYHINGQCTPRVSPRTSSNVNAYKTLISVGGGEIKYAWDRPDEVKLELFTKIGFTTHLVVIGYSFPVFNREIDREILKAEKLEKIYIQDKKEALPAIKNRVEALLGHRSKFVPPQYAKDRGIKGIDPYEVVVPQEGVEIVLIDDTDQFHIPFELV